MRLRLSTKTMRIIYQTWKQNDPAGPSRTSGENFTSKPDCDDHHQPLTFKIVLRHSHSHPHGKDFPLHSLSRSPPLTSKRPPFRDQLPVFSGWRLLGPGRSAVFYERQEKVAAEGWMEAQSVTARSMMEAWGDPDLKQHWPWGAGQLGTNGWPFQRACQRSDSILQTTPTWQRRSDREGKLICIRPV